MNVSKQVVRLAAIGGGVLVLVGLLVGAVLPVRRGYVPCGTGWFPATTGARYIEEYCEGVAGTASTVAVLIMVVGLVVMLGSIAFAATTGR